MYKILKPEEFIYVNAREAGNDVDAPWSKGRFIIGITDVDYENCIEYGYIIAYTVDDNKDNSTMFSWIGQNNKRLKEEYNFMQLGLCEGCQYAEGINMLGVRLE